MAWYKLDEEGNIEGLLKPLTPAINYVARLNGTDQYWQLSEDINLLDSDIVNFKFVGGVVSGTFRRFIGSNNFSFGLSSGSTGSVFNEVNMSASLDGASIESESTQIPLSGSHNVSCSIVGAHTLSQLCAADSSRLMNLPLYEFEVIRNGTVIHEIPLTNKAQGATQLATVGNVNATMVGYDESVWEVLPELWYNKTTGMVICSDKLIECNDEVIPCL